MTTSDPSPKSRKFLLIGLLLAVGGSLVAVLYHKATRTEAQEPLVKDSVYRAGSGESGPRVAGSETDDLARSDNTAAFEDRGEPAAIPGGARDTGALEAQGDGYRGTPAAKPDAGSREFGPVGSYTGAVVGETGDPEVSDYPTASIRSAAEAGIGGGLQPEDTVDGGDRQDVADSGDSEDTVDAEDEPGFPLEGFWAGRLESVSATGTDAEGAQWPCAGADVNYLRLRWEGGYYSMSGRARVDIDFIATRRNPALARSLSFAGQVAADGSIVNGNSGWITLSGTFGGSPAQGNWTDELGCSGTWNFTFYLPL